MGALPPTLNAKVRVAPPSPTAPLKPCLPSNFSQSHHYLRFRLSTDLIKSINKFVLLTLRIYLYFVRLSIKNKEQEVFSHKLANGFCRKVSELW